MSSSPHSKGKDCRLRVLRRPPSALCCGSKTHAAVVIIITSVPKSTPNVSTCSIDILSHHTSSSFHNPPRFKCTQLVAASPASRSVVCCQQVRGPELPQHVYQHWHTGGEDGEKLQTCAPHERRCRTNAGSASPQVVRISKVTTDGHSYNTVPSQRLDAVLSLLHHSH
jgi:hypothetical protein